MNMDIDWIVKHFNGELEWGEFAAAVTHLDEHKEPVETWFMMTAASVKYRWDWLTDAEKEEVIGVFRRCLEEIEATAVLKTKLAAVEKMRKWFRAHKWVLLSAALDGRTFADVEVRG